MRRFRFAAALFLCMCLLLSCAAAAAGTGKTGAISILDAPDGNAAGGVLFQVWRVGDVVDGRLVWLDAFAGYGLKLDANDSDSFTRLPESLRQYLLRDGVAADLSGTSDSSGKVRFEGLEQGLYLITGGSHERGSTRYHVSPCLVILPYLVSGGDGAARWQADVTVKHTTEAIYSGGSGSGTISRKVMKLWNDEGFEGQRPDSVTVQLLRDGEVYRTAVLDEGNGWKHTWTGLGRNYDWYVVEDGVPVGYAEEIEQQGTTFVITNARTSNIGDTETPGGEDPGPSPSPSVGPGTSPSPSTSVPPGETDPGTSAPPTDDLTDIDPTDPPAGTTDFPGDGTPPVTDTPVVTGTPVVSTPGPDGPAGPGLPQTGQHWMEVFALSIIGLFSILISVAMRGQTKLKEDMDRRTWDAGNRRDV